MALLSFLIASSFLPRSLRTYLSRNTSTECLISSAAVFTSQIDRRTPKDLDLHLILDNYGTHKHKNVTDWLELHPRFHMHFVPTGCSWLNLVERFFAQNHQPKDSTRNVR